MINPVPANPHNPFGSGAYFHEKGNFCFLMTRHLVINEKIADGFLFLHAERLKAVAGLPIPQSKRTSEDIEVNVLRVRALSDLIHQSPGIFQFTS